MGKKFLAMVITTLLFTSLLGLSANAFGTFEVQGFETGDVATNGAAFMDGWRTSFNVSASTEEQLTGERSLKIENRGEEKEFIYRSTDVTVGTTYIFSAWVKIDGTLTVYPGKSAAYVQIGIGSPAWLSFGDCPNVANTTNNQWIMLRKEFTATEATAQLVLRVFQASAGTVYFDDVSFMPKDESSVYVNGGFDEVATQKNGDTEYLWANGWTNGGYYSTPGKNLKISTAAGKSGYGLEMSYVDTTQQVFALYNVTNKLTVGKWYSLSAWGWRSPACAGARRSGIYFTTSNNSTANPIVGDYTEWGTGNWRQFATPAFRFTQEMKDSGNQYYIMLHISGTDTDKYTYWDNVELKELGTKVSFKQNGTEATTLTKGTDATVTVEYFNDTEEAKQPYVVLGSYTKTDAGELKLTDIKVKRASEAIAAGTVGSPMTETVTVSADAAVVKVMLLDTMSTIKPLISIAELK